MQAQLSNAENRLSYTDLRADANGTVTARGVEPGEVVQAGRMILQIAQEGGATPSSTCPRRSRTWRRRSRASRSR
jgi:multidrug efflux pump subunit AcrA (membrane-fusion protein)